MRTRTVRLLSAVVALGALPLTASSAQQSAAPAAPPGQLTVGPAVGTEAPDFEFKGITKYGALEKRAKLSDFRGQTVVLAFFPKARTKG